MLMILTTKRGSAIVYIILLFAIILFIPVMAQMITVSTKETKQQLLTTAMADNVARAGLVDTVSWFRRQMIVKSNGYYPNPDDAFYPRQATGDTEDETIGLVKSYALNDQDKIWGRYEIVRQLALPQPYNAHAVHDITDQRTTFSAGEGLVWYLESRGFVYNNIDKTKPFNQEPNKILSATRMSGEIRQISIALPVNSAVTCMQGNQVNVYNNGVIDGGDDAYGIARVSGSGANMLGGTVSGNPSAQFSGIVNPSVNYVFGVPDSDLKVLADYFVDNPSAIPNPYPTISFVYIEGDIEFNNTHPLKGGGILYVKGNLKLNSTSNSLFSGLIYVTGISTIEGPALIQGAVVSLNGMDISGNGDVAEIDFDSSILTTVRQQLAYYRENKSSLVPIPQF